VDPAFIFGSRVDVPNVAAGDVGSLLLLCRPTQLLGVACDPHGPGPNAPAVPPMTLSLWSRFSVPNTAVGSVTFFDAP
jgi:hypothetical protein